MNFINFKKWKSWTRRICEINILDWVCRWVFS